MRRIIEITERNVWGQEWFQTQEKPPPGIAVSAARKDQPGYSVHLQALHFLFT